MGIVRRFAWVILPLALFLTHCAPISQPTPPSTGASSSMVSSSEAPSKRDQQLWAEVHQWTGTPHRMGGTDRSGVDCSGFVQRVYRDLYGVQLPRTTADQVHHGKKIDSRDLQGGDLVFFLPPGSVRHVGIYLGEGRFAHASKSNGVMVSSIHEPYWRKAFWTARRVLLQNS